MVDGSMHVLTSVDEPVIHTLLADQRVFWIDLLKPDDQEVERLGALLDLHPLALEDTLEFGQRPKVDRYGNRVLFVFFTAKPPAAAVEVHVHIAGRFVATVRHDDCEELDALHTELAQTAVADLDHLLYRVFDGLTDPFYLMIDGLEKVIDQLEADVLADPRRELLTRCYHLKQDVRDLHRLAQSQAESFTQAQPAVLGLPGLGSGSEPYFRDISDHLTQVAGEFLRQTDDLASLAQTYFSANSDRLNVVATRIALGGTVFVIWSVVTGFFGMNFGWLLDRQQPGYAFFAYGLPALVVPMLLLLARFWVKRDAWF
jgi:magnesium transporter